VRLYCDGHSLHAGPVQWFEQRCEVQFGYVSLLLKHWLQSAPWKLFGQSWQELPVQLLRHLHVQPEFTLPVTAVERPLQLALVQDWKQFGYPS